MVSTNAIAMKKVNDENSLQLAIAEANIDSSIDKIVFEKNIKIILTNPVIYNGKQSIMLDGSGAIIDGSSAGVFLLDRSLTTNTDKGSLVFNTAADIKINNLTIVNSAIHGIVINIPDDASGDDIKVTLNKVNILVSELFGLHIDDIKDNYDNGVLGA
jgi:hypothetical protein